MTVAKPMEGPDERVPVRLAAHGDLACATAYAAEVSTSPLTLEKTVIALGARRSTSSIPPT